MRLILRLQISDLHQKVTFWSGMSGYSILLPPYYVCNANNSNYLDTLTYFSQCIFSLPPENSEAFLLFSGRRESVHWEQMG